MRNLIINVFNTLLQCNALNQNYWCKLKFYADLESIDRIHFNIFEDFRILDSKMKFSFYYLLLGVEHSNKFFKQMV